MKIAAFNVKNLGLKKVRDKTVVRYLTKIMSQYSVVVILEVMDKSGEAMKKLLQELNNTGNSKKKKDHYSMTASIQLGRDSYKEKFVCFYREDEVELTACYQYEDDQAGDEDAFAREPYVLRFRCPTTVVKDLVLIPVHTKPDDSLKELDELHDVVKVIRKKWKTDNIMILGDFNADGRYLSKRNLENIRIRSPLYHWLIHDDVDTTSSNFNEHTYDRIVVYGQNMKDAIVPESAKSFNFQKEFKLTDETTLNISDHYPVEVELKTDQKHKAAKQRMTVVHRTTKTTSTKGQTQRQKKKTEPAGPQKKKTEPAGPQKKKTEPAGPQKKTEPAGPQKKKTEPAGPQKKTEPAGPQKKKTEPAGPQKKTEPAGPQKKKTEPAGPQKKKADPTGPHKKKADPTGPQKKKTEPAGPQKKKTEPAGPQKKKADPTGPQKKKTEPAGPQKKKADPTGPQKKKTEPAGPQKKKADPTGPQKKKRNMTCKRKQEEESLQSRDPPTKRRRLNKDRTDRL